jgi:predicted nucleic acid-binding protein
MRQAMRRYGEAIEFFKSLPDFPRRQALPRVFLRQIRTYDLTYAILERYAEVRRMMRPPCGAGQIEDMDTLITTTALEHDLSVVTIDSDFICVPGLSIRHLLPAALKS